MVYQIIFKKRFQDKLENLLIHIEKKFGLLIAQKFAQELDGKLKMLQQQPSIGKPSTFIANTRSIIAGNHNRLYYRTEGNQLIILDMYDMRINPKRNKLK